MRRELTILVCSKHIRSTKLAVAVLAVCRGDLGFFVLIPKYHMRFILFSSNTFITKYSVLLRRQER